MKWRELDEKHPARHSSVLHSEAVAVNIDGPLVYFVRAGKRGNIKIGFSSSSRHLKKRISSLQIGSPLPIILIGAVRGSMMDEQSAHRALEHHRVSGEWFARSRAVTSYVMHALSIGRIPNPHCVEDSDNCGAASICEPSPTT